MRKNIFLSILILFCLVSCTKKTVDATYDIIPLPQKVELNADASFLLDGGVVIDYQQDEDLKSLARFLKEYIEESTGHKLQEGIAGKRIILTLNPQITNSEGYCLTVTSENIQIEGGSKAGLFYGIQTLRKTMANANKDNVNFASAIIEDYPRFAYRGMMLDVARHFSTIDYLKEHIDILALHNINKFHIHLTDDQGWRVEIKKYPKLTEVGSQRKGSTNSFVTRDLDSIPHGGYYTQDELKEIVKYAQERYIEIIPEIDLPGHMTSALASYPELGCTGGPYEVQTRWGIFPDILCGGNEKTLEFLTDVLGEIADIFPSQYVHIGGDEAIKNRWKQCSKCQSKIKELGFKDDGKDAKESKLQSYITQEVEKFLSTKGKKIIGWDEIIEGGLAPNATVMSWRGEEGGRFAAKAGHDVIMCPNSHLYLDYYQTKNTRKESEAFPGINTIEEVYTFNPIPQGLTAEEEKRILGMQANLWRELIPEADRVQYMVLPRLAALAENQWSAVDRKNYNQFLYRLQTFVKHYDRKGYNYSTAPFEVQVHTIKDEQNNVLKVDLSTYDNADIYYSLDGSEPSTKSIRYTSPIIVDKIYHIKARAIRNNEILDKNIVDDYFTVDKATFKAVELLTEPSKYFNPPKGKDLIVDGERGDGVHIFGDPTSWIGFAQRMELIIDLATVEEISNVMVGTLLMRYNVKELDYKISLSKDGSNYNQVFEQTMKFDNVADLEAKIDKTKARYIKIELIADASSHILVDEIIVE